MKRAKQVLVLDTNVLIDLIALDLLDRFLSLNYIFETVDLILEELHDQQVSQLMPHLQNKQLEVISYSPERLLEVVRLAEKHPRLSLQDCALWVHARQRKAILLTGDKVLRQLAARQKLEVHGHLWFFDRLVGADRLIPELAASLLEKLAFRINPQLGLPAQEVKIRLTKWKEG